MRTHVRIRQATEEDAGVISELIVPLVERFIAPDITEEGRRNLLASMTPDSIRQHFRDGLRYHVYEEHGTVLGMAATRDDRHLCNLFVAKDAQRRGIGRLLWEAARAACLDAGGDGNFTVNSSRYAVLVYESFGFTRNGPVSTRDGITCFPMLLKAG